MHEEGEATRKFEEDIARAFDDLESGIEEFHDLGSGVTCGVNVTRGRPHGSSGFVEGRFGVVAVWRDGRIARANTNYNNVDQARAAAERLAEQGG